MEIARFMSLIVMAVGAAAAPQSGIYGMDMNVNLIRQYANGSSVRIGGPIANELQAQELSTLDEKNGILYLVGYNLTTTKTNVVGVSLSTGAVVSETPLPWIETDIVGVGQNIAWEPTSGRFIGGGQLIAGGAHTVGFIDVHTGVYSQVAAISGGYLPVLGGPCVYVPETNSLVLTLGVNNSIAVFSVDMGTGKVSQWPEDFSDGHDIQTMDYDAATGRIVGLGIAPNATGGYDRVVVTLDPKAFTYTRVGAIDGYLIMSSSIAAADSSNRILYWIGQKTGSSPTDPFYLIGVSMDNADVKSAALLCSSDPVCPWSLEFLNQ